MRNVWLIFKREYLTRIRTKGFILFTILMPLFVFAVVVVPSKLMMRSGATKQVVIVCANRALGESMRQSLMESDKRLAPTEPGADDERNIGPKFDVALRSTLDDATERELHDQVNADKISGYLWLSEAALQAGRVEYKTKNAGSFTEIAAVQSALRTAVTRSQLTERGLSPADVEKILKPVRLETVTVKASGEKKANGIMAFLLPMLLMMMIYMSLIIYGVSVMRSVIEEKTTRVVEVLLSSVSPLELMAGKILGVGSVGLTQMTIWAVFGVLIGTPAGLAMRSFVKLDIPLEALIFLPVFFLLGYLLYSTLYAAVGAMCNSDEEAQQLQWPVLMPIIFCVVFASVVIGEPNSKVAFWLSIFPLTSPIIMFVRCCVQPPHAWELALCVALLILAIFAAMWLCSRIYRVGILMYGKRPTLPEIVKWIRHA